MTPELYFIYDSHCPWSYASMSLLNTLKMAYPDMVVNTMHCAHYDGSDCAGREQLTAVSKQSSVKFADQYLRFVDSPKDATVAANLMAWVQTKQPAKALEVINAIQIAHFVEGNPMGCKHDFSQIIERLRLSPPNKVFNDKLSKEAEYVLSDIGELQGFIGTTAFPALLLTVGDKAVLLNHSLYLERPEAIVEAVKLELN